MARSRHPSKSSSSVADLGRVERGELLGALDRREAEGGFSLYRGRRVEQILWTGDGIEASFGQPACTVRIDEVFDGPLPLTHCSVCGDRETPCAHAVAALFRWIDIRPTMLRRGPGTVWHARARRQFQTVAGPETDRVELTHLRDSELRSALELHLSLHQSGRAVGRLQGGEVEISIDLPSGCRRTLSFDAAGLPQALPILRSLPKLSLQGDLKKLEISETRLHPSLVASWTDEGILLEPGYRLAGDAFVPLEDVQRVSLGKWARVGSRLCRLLDPDTPLIPLFRQGRRLLAGNDALQFLTLDHPVLKPRSWYHPRGGLASFKAPVQPTLAALHTTLESGGKVRVRPSFRIGQRDLDWDEILILQRSGFGRYEGVIARAPDLGRLEGMGFRLPRRGAGSGLTGNQIAFIRMVAETSVPVITDSPRLRRLADILRGEEQLEVRQPPGLRSKLRGYQREGVAWLWARYEVGLGALLADDMGLGKTHQVMALLCLVRDRDPASRFLVVCPRGVLEHWSHLLSIYAPELSVLIFHGPRRSSEDLLRGESIVLTTYDTLVRSATDLVSHPWSAAVFDEAQRVKNPRTKAARATRRLNADFRVALTGTPLENRLPELWSVVNTILPSYLGSEREFRTAYRNPTQSQLQRLRKRLSVITLRRLKEQVLSELPAKIEDLRYCRLTSEQRAVYRTVLRQKAPAIARQLKDKASEIPYIHIFALLTRLKQVCDHPGLVDSAAGRGESGKLVVFDEILEEALATEQQVVVFTQYVTMVRLLERHLDRLGVEHLVLTGETRKRGQVIRRFNSGQHERVLLASLLAGGVGIDLTGASVVIHYDRWWNPAKEDQATDRVHRIGQRRFVQVFKLVTRDTIEERIDRIIRDKLKLIDEVVAPTDEVVRSLGRKELADVLGIDLAQGADS